MCSMVHTGRMAAGQMVHTGRMAAGQMVHTGRMAAGQMTPLQLLTLNRTKRRELK